MKWKLIDNKARLQPPTGDYTHWKIQIARSCFRQCVYCAIHESQFGGIRNFSVEHYRPKSLFKALRDIITNLYLACGICNSFKCDDWPNEPAVDHSLEAYPDPGAVDYNTILEIGDRHEVVGLNTASRYLVERLFLNRHQLIIERWHYSVEARIEAFSAFAGNAFAAFEQLGALDGEGTALFAQLGKAVCELSSERDQLRKLVPYDDKDVTRPPRRGDTKKSKNRAAGTSRRRR